MEQPEKVELNFLIGMAANQLMPSIIKSGDIMSTLNNKDAVINQSINIAKTIATKVVERVGDEEDVDIILTAASSANQALAAMIARDPEGTFANIEKRTEVAIDMVIELNKRVDDTLEEDQ
jgi:hypothetical protein